MGQLAGIVLASVFLGVEYKVGIVLRPVDFLLLGTLFLIFATSPYGRIPYLPLSAPMTIFSILLLYMTANGIAQSPLSVAIKDAIQAAEILLLFYLVRIARATSTRRENFDRTVIALLFAIAVFTIAYHIARGEFVGYKSLDEPKLTFGILALYVLVRLWEKPSPASLVLFLLSFALLFLSGERKGWAGAFTALAMFILVRRYSNPERKLIATTLILLAAAIASITLSSSSGYISKQLASIPDFLSHLTDSDFNPDSIETISNRYRAMSAHATFDIISDNPVFGVGPEMLTKVMQDRHLWFIGTREGTFSQDVHNEYLRLAAEGGMIALGLYVAAWAALVLQSLRNIIRLNRAGPGLQPEERMRAWFPIGLVCYGLAINFFLAGGLLNSIFFIWPAAMIVDFQPAMRSSEVRSAT